MNRKQAPPNTGITLIPEFRNGIFLAVPTKELLSLLSRASNTLDPLETPDWLWKLLHPTESPIQDNVDPDCVILFSHHTKGR